MIAHLKLLIFAQEYKLYTPSHPLAKQGSHAVQYLLRNNRYIFTPKIIVALRRSFKLDNLVSFQFLNIHLYIYKCVREENMSNFTI